MNKPLLDREHWTRVAAEWTAWARSPKHDAFWAYREALIAYLGKGSGKTLEVGCGEGRISRELKALGYRVTAADTVAELVEAARQADSAHAYAVADARDLPFDDSSFDQVVAYNVLMDVEDVPSSLREIRRVMRPHGQLFISIVHPFRDRGNFANAQPDAPFVLEGSYFGRQRFEGVEERGGLRMHFAGWSQPLEAYAGALEEAGLAITSIREPIPDHSEGQEHLKQWTRVPMFLWLKARPIGLATG
jgi:SAM-dependent methyltransferase